MKRKRRSLRRTLLRIKKKKYYQRRLTLAGILRTAQTTQFKLRK